MTSRTVVISGAGIAGCTLAYWMARNGWSVTVIERGASLRTTGSPVDVRGPAAHVAERMNIASQLREARIRIDGVMLLDSVGRRTARVDIGMLRSVLAPNDIEIARGDLALILHAASADTAEYVFGDFVQALAQDDTGVDVTFERSRARRFDLVVGADGMHSNVRRLVYGAEAEFVRHAGLYAATVALPRCSDAGARCSCSGHLESWWHSTPAREIRSPISSTGTRNFPSSTIGTSTSINVFSKSRSAAWVGECRSSSTLRARPATCISTRSLACRLRTGRGDGSRSSVMQRPAYHCSAMGLPSPSPVHISSPQPWRNARQTCSAPSVVTRPSTASL